MADKPKKNRKIIKLKSLLGRRKPFIIRMPEEKDDSIHWLFWWLVILVLVFLISIIIISWSNSSALLSYIQK